MSKLKVLSFYAGPGAGKSTAAAGLFHIMKTRGASVELVTEYAKDMTWEARHNILSDQIYMFAKQRRRIDRLVGQVEWVVTDSPLLLSLAYCPPGLPPQFQGLVRECFTMYDNYGIKLHRFKPYIQAGRNQTEEEARQLDLTIHGLCDEMAGSMVQTMSLRGDNDAPRKVFETFGLDD